MADHPRCEATGKRCFGSARRARLATRTASNRLRVYRCEHCNRLHVSDADERPSHELGRMAVAPARRASGWDE
jgi:uncharacterized protein YwlG (UPF0340 family)